MTGQPHGVRITRRGVLAASGAALIGLAGGIATAGGAPAPAAAEQIVESKPLIAKDPYAAKIAFHGEHQSGVETHVALHQTFIGFNLRERNRDAAEAVCRLVSDDAARLMAGQPALGDTEPDLAKSPSNLTITLGVGRGFYSAVGAEPPTQLRVIPAFSTDEFEKGWEQTDFVLQIGSDDPATLAHAVRMLTKDLRDLAKVAWMQDGFQQAAPANPGTPTRRNLMGQVDGTKNPTPGTDNFREIVWIDDPNPAIDGGTVLVLRRIRMLMDKWELLDLSAQERAIGRHQTSGAPLGQEGEFDEPDFDAVDSDGLPVIPLDSHVAVAYTDVPSEQLFRRAYNYNAGMRNGENDMGLIFAAYMRDPATSFIPMQERLAKHDAFNEWITTVSSATYFIVPGAKDGEFLLESLFAQ